MAGLREEGSCRSFLLGLSVHTPVCRFQSPCPVSRAAPPQGALCTRHSSNRICHLVRSSSRTSSPAVQGMAMGWPEQAHTAALGLSEHRWHRAHPTWGPSTEWPSVLPGQDWHMGPAACGEKQRRPAPRGRGSSSVSSSPHPQCGGPRCPGGQCQGGLYCCSEPGTKRPWQGCGSAHRYRTGMAGSAHHHGQAVAFPGRDSGAGCGAHGEHWWVPVPCPLSQTFPPIQPHEAICQATQYKSINVCALSITLLHPQGQI